MSENVIEVQDLTKRYNGTAVVNGISFSVARGEIFGLLGPNGAGKTTTILMMLGLSDISAGRRACSATIRCASRSPVKRRVGYLPDQVGFYDNLTAADNLRYTARLMGIERGEREDKIAAALGACRARRRGRQARRDLLARHAPAARAGRDPDEGRADRDSRRADVGSRSAGDRRAARHHPRAQASTA